MKKSRQKRSRRRKPRTATTLGPPWQACWLDMQRIMLQDRDPEQVEGCAISFGWRADLIAQAYFQALRKNVPSERDDSDMVILGTPLNHSERLLLSHLRSLNEWLCEMALAGRWHACTELWDQAFKLTDMFCKLAQKSPGPFKRKARVSLMMPSLRVPPTLRRTRNGRKKWIDPFLGDAPGIANAIELSADAVGAKISDNRVRLGGLCARLVGEFVHEIKRARSHWSAYFTPYQKTVIWPTKHQVQPFANQTHDQLITGIMRESHSQPRSIESYIRMFCLQVDCGVQRLHFLLLPELTRERADVWWKKAIKKMVEAKFDFLLQEPEWGKELRAASTGTKADMLKELKDYSRDKVKQFA